MWNTKKTSLFAECNTNCSEVLFDTIPWTVPRAIVFQHRKGQIIDMDLLWHGYY